MSIIRKRYFDDGREPETIYDDTPPPRTVTHTEQQQTGMVKRNNFVAAEVTAVAKRGPAVPMTPEFNHALSVPLSATQHIEVRTSDEDRARGFALRTRQLGIVISTAMVVASVTFVKVPVFSFWSLSIFVLTYAAVWLYAYYLALTRSAEGVAYNESNRKWDYLDRHQERMWNHYDRLTGGK